MLSNCGVGEDASESLGLQGDSVHPKGDQSWVFIGRTDAEPEAPILWAPNVKSQLIRKDPDAGKDWRQEKWTTEDEMDGWHHQLSGREFEQAPGDGDGQGSLACCNPWGCKELDTTDWLNNNSKILIKFRNVFWWAVGNRLERSNYRKIKMLSESCCTSFKQWPMTEHLSLTELDFHVRLNL